MPSAASSGCAFAPDFFTEWHTAALRRGHVSHALAMGPPLNPTLHRSGVSMFGISDFSAFVVAILLFLLIPGPGNLALITSTGKGGIRAGMAACAGVLAADQVLIWMAVAGVAALLASYPTAFHAVQWLGAAYLGWLGFRMLTAKPGDKPVLHIEPRHYFRQAGLITLMNPKSLGF